MGYGEGGDIDRAQGDVFSLDMLVEEALNRWVSSLTAQQPSTIR